MTLVTRLLCLTFHLKFARMFWLQLKATPWKSQKLVPSKKSQFLAITKKSSRKIKKITHLYVCHTATPGLKYMVLRNEMQLAHNLNGLALLHSFVWTDCWTHSLLRWIQLRCRCILTWITPAEVFLKLVGFNPLLLLKVDIHGEYLLPLKSPL